MDAQFERHQPLITARLIFAPKVLPPPPIITARMEFPPFNIPQYRSPTPETPGKHSSTKRHTTPKHASTSKRNSTPQRDAIGNSVAFENMDVDSDTTSQQTSTSKRQATPRRLGGTSVTFEIDQDLGSPLSSLSDDDGLESEKDEEINNKTIPKPPGEAGRPQSGGYNLQDKLGWNDSTYEIIVVSMRKMYGKYLTRLTGSGAQDGKSQAKHRTKFPWTR